MLGKKWFLVADVTKCQGVGCEKRDTCRRYLDKEADEHGNYWQCEFWRDLNGSSKCGYYWNVNMNIKE